MRISPAPTANLYYDGWAIPNRPFPFLCHPCDSINMVMPVRRFLPVFTFLATHSGSLQSHPTPDPAGALITAPGHAVVSYLAPGSGGPVGQLWRCWRGHFSKSGSKWEWHPTKEAYNGLFFFFSQKSLCPNYMRLFARRVLLSKSALWIYAVKVEYTQPLSIWADANPSWSHTRTLKISNAWMVICMKSQQLLTLV